MGPVVVFNILAVALAPSSKKIRSPITVQVGSTGALLRPVVSKSKSASNSAAFKPHMSHGRATTFKGPSKHVLPAVSDGFSPFHATTSSPLQRLCPLIKAAAAARNSSVGQTPPSTHTVASAMLGNLRCK